MHEINYFESPFQNQSLKRDHLSVVIEIGELLHRLHACYAYTAINIGVDEVSSEGLTDTPKRFFGSDKCTYLSMYLVALDKRIQLAFAYYIDVEPDDRYTFDTEYLPSKHCFIKYSENADSSRLYVVECVHDALLAALSIYNEFSNSRNLAVYKSSISGTKVVVPPVSSEYAIEEVDDPRTHGVYTELPKNEFFDKYPFLLEMPGLIITGEGPTDWMDNSIDVLKLSNRFKKVLLENDIQSIRSLASRSSEDLMRLPNVGKSLQENALAALESYLFEISFEDVYDD